MSYRQPKYIAPADANEAIEKFNESMKSFADTAKQQNQQQWCRENPGACKDDERDSDSDSDSDSKSSTSTTSTKALKPPTPSKPKSQGTKINFGTGLSGTVGGAYNVNYDPMDPSTW